MAMGKRKRERQAALWVDAAVVSNAPGHPFYERLNELLAGHGFDEFVEATCERFYAPVMGRPSLAPGIYFRLLLVGYFEGIDILSTLGMAYAAEGDRSRAQSILEELESRDRAGYVPATALAAAHLGLGNTQGALDLLEGAYRERDARLAFLGIDARWNALRADPRFQELSQRLGLEADWAYGRF